ncbi:glycosyltransferase family 2 protein [Ruegeria hyattellae]|uniref:glycosyltransferase family 2 protein n=1 Tax=Ruegeria hyattellae TaxID=3233337 RepID=UPI00355C8269
MTAQKTPAPEISVIVPVHNVQDHIGACLTSLREQSFTDFEAIIIDDGSSDDSPVRLRAAIDGDTRFRVIRQDNRGLSGARNTGLDTACGTFIAFLDGDDRYAPEFLEHMQAALASGTADWVACGLRNIHADGHSDTHSTIHDAPVLDPDTGPRLWPLTDWGEVTAHFPSAWNKLYRRSLIDGLRFDEGTWFEDHAFFLRAAARTQTLLHLPEPLYLQTRGRAGQITASDSDRVFEQIAVLDTLAGLMAGQEKPGGTQALARLAHRLFHERGGILRDSGRRDRFLTAARDWLAAQGLPPRPGPDLPPSWALELAGTCPLSVVIPWDGQDGPLRVTATALAHQRQTGFETLIVADDAVTAARSADLAREAGLHGARGLSSDRPGPGPARNTGLAQARGELVVFADAGDRLRPDALAHWTDSMLREAADLGLSQFRMGQHEDSPVHQGFHDMTLLGEEAPETGPLPLNADRALALHCYPTAKIFRRAFLDTHGLRFGRGTRSDWQIGIGAALAARKALYFAWPGAESAEAAECRQLWTAQVPPATLARMLDDAWESWPQDIRDALPKNWAKRLYTRALWEVWSFSDFSAKQRSRFRFEAVRELRQRRWLWQSGPLDPYLSTAIYDLVTPSAPRP